MRVVLAVIVVVLATACGASNEPASVGDDRRAGEQIAFVRGGEEPGIYVMSADGRDERLVVPDGSSPAWSPDGALLAYEIGEWTRKKGHRSAIWVAKADGSEAKELAGDRASRPTWSPDGQRIAFDRELGLWVAAADGTGERALSFEVGGMTGGEPAWSPHGEEIATGSLEGIVVMKVDGSGERLLTTQSLDGEPSWSPDGRRLAFTRLDGNPGLNGPWTRSIYVVNADGSGVRRLTRGASDGSPTWSADGSRIVFKRTPVLDLARGGDVVVQLEEYERLSELYEVRVDGTGIRRLTHNQVPDGSPQWGPPAGATVPPAEKADGELVRVPDVTRLSFLAAAERLERAGLEARRPREANDDPYAQLVVVTQSPKAGADVRLGTPVALLTWDVSDPFGGRPFDRDLWLRSDDCAYDSPRARMYDNLVRNHLRRGMPRKAVLRLLGQPYRDDDWPLGYASGFRVDCDFLRVEFDRAGRVAQVSHWQS